MIKEELTRSSSKYSAVFTVVLLALVALLMAACSSGQASSSAASSSTQANSSTSAAASSSRSEASQKESAVDISGFVGTWDMVDMEKDDIRVSEMNPGAVEIMREDNYLNITEDGFYDLVEDGYVIQGVWEANSPTEGTMLYPSQEGAGEMTMVIDGDKLKVGPADGVILYFEKGDSRETPSLPEGQQDLRVVLGD